MSIDTARRQYESLRLGELPSEGMSLDAELFLPVITYPPLCCLEEQADDSIVRGTAATSERGLAAYFHIPFCRTRCSFCHWVVRTGTSDADKAHYLDSLEQEMVLHKRRLGVERIPVRSVLVGGGTPTLLSPPLLVRFLESVHRHFDLSQCRQFTCEPEPVTILGAQGAEVLRILHAHGVQRLSMGVQSFDDTLLRTLGRTHDGHQALRAIERIREAGFSSISIDLIYGLPEQTLESWVETMLQAVRSGADAWQLYRLRILPHGDSPGRIASQYQRAPNRFPGVDDVLLMKLIGIEVSREHGFDQWYTRIFARGAEHISQYLHDVNVGLLDVVGSGVSSWSNFGNVFTNNIGPDFEAWHDRILRGQIPIDRGLVRSSDEETRRCFILPLKNDRLHKPAFEARTGMTAASQFGPTLERLKRLDLLAEDDQYLWLTPRGRFCADEVAALFFDPRHVRERQLEPVSAAS